MNQQTNEYIEGKLIELVDKGAALEHARWARWQKYVHSKCIPVPHETEMPHCYCSPDKTAFQNGNMVIVHKKESALTIPFELVERWEKQIATTYSSLSEDEKESDRKEVREYIPLFRAALTETWNKSRLDAIEEARQRIEECEWKCPEHGKEFRITLPLCKECNQCLEVNTVLAEAAATLSTMRQEKSI